MAIFATALGRPLQPVADLLHVAAFFVFRRRLRGLEARATRIEWVHANLNEIRLLNVCQAQAPRSSSGAIDFGNTVSYLLRHWVLFY